MSSFSRGSVSDLSYSSCTEIQRRTRFNSDNPFEMRKSSLTTENEDYKSEDEVRRVNESSSSDGNCLEE